MQTPSPLQSASWRITLLRVLKFALVGGLIAAFTWSAFHELRQIHWHEVRTAFAEIDRHRIAFAVLCLLANYLLLTFYDLLSFRVLGLKLSWGAVAPRAAAAFAFSNFVGLGFVSGAAVRLRLYRDLCPQPATLAKVIALNGISLWIGLFATVGVAMFWCEQPMMAPGKSADLRRLAPLLVALPLLWVIFAGSRNLLPEKIRSNLPPLSWKQVLFLLLLASADWITLAAIYIALLGPLPPEKIVGAATGFWLSYVIAMLSVIPAGVGIFEAAITSFIGPITPPEEVLAAAFAYRAIYYFFPWLLAVLGMGLVAAVPMIGRVAPSVPGRLRGFEPTMQEIVTETLAILSFVAGAVLWFSAAVPGYEGRLEIAAWAFPLPGYLVATSHFLTVTCGALLIVLSPGLQNRHKESWSLTMGTLLAAAVFTFLKGLDFEESAFLLVVAALFFSARDRYDRAGHALHPRLARTAFGAIVAAVVVYVALGSWVHRDTSYDPDVWTSVAIHADRARFLRSLLPVTGVLAWILVSLRWSAGRPVVPSPVSSDIALVERILRTHGRSSLSTLATLGDKAIWFSPGRDAFLAWQTRGRTLLALGDPVGPPTSQRELIRELRRYADEWDLIPAFYQVPADRLGDYHGMGFSFFQIGEEGLIDLGVFEDPGVKEPPEEPRPAMAFEIVPAIGARDDEPARSLLQEMRIISDAHLEESGAAEKRFAAAFFDEAFVRRFPLVLMRRAGSERTLLGFAVILSTADRKELSIDLARWRPEEGADVYEALLAWMLAWGRREGYATFNLGLAPMPAAGPEAYAKLERTSRILFLHGERFYNFRRVRGFDQRFRPRWEPRFVAVPAEWLVPRVLVDTALLISGTGTRERDEAVETELSTAAEAR